MTLWEATLDLSRGGRQRWTYCRSCLGEIEAVVYNNHHACPAYVLEYYCPSLAGRDPYAYIGSLLHLVLVACLIACLLACHFCWLVACLIACLLACLEQIMMIIPSQLKSGSSCKKVLCCWLLSLPSRPSPILTQAIQYPAVVSLC